MPSWQARIANAAVRTFVRRESWGDDDWALARRARRVFGSPRLYGWWRTRGLRVRPVAEGAVRGEWIEPPNGEAGVILYVHGGGYVSCSPATHRPVTAALARLTRRRVFSLDYRLAPEHRFPAAQEDALVAYRWLLAREVEAGALALAGDSAGGGLVLATLLRARDAGLPRAACAVCFSPWADLAGTGETVRRNDKRCEMFRTPNIAEFARAYLDSDTSPRDAYASPLFADLSGLPPLLLQVGSNELLLDDARGVDERVRAAGGASRLEVYADVFHCWQMTDGLVPEARAALRQAAAFIRDHANAASRSGP